MKSIFLNCFFIFIIVSEDTFRVSEYSKYASAIIVKKVPAEYFSAFKLRMQPFAGISLLDMFCVI